MKNIYLSPIFEAEINDAITFFAIVTHLPSVDLDMFKTFVMNLKDILTVKTSETSLIDVDELLILLVY